MDLPTVVPPDFSDDIKWQIIGEKERSIHGWLERDEQNHAHFSIRICKPGEADPETRIGAAHYYRFWDKRSICGEEVTILGQPMLKRWGFARDGEKRCLAIRSKDGAWDNVTGFDCEYKIKPIFSGEKLIGILFEISIKEANLIRPIRVMRRKD